MTKSNLSMILCMFVAIANLVSYNSKWDNISFWFFVILTIWFFWFFYLSLEECYKKK